MLSVHGGRLHLRISERCYRCKKYWNYIIFSPFISKAYLVLLVFRMNEYGVIVLVYSCRLRNWVRSILIRSSFSTHKKTNEGGGEFVDPKSKAIDVSLKLVCIIDNFFKS